MLVYRVTVRKGGRTDTYTVGEHIEAEEYARDFRSAGYTVEVWSRDLRIDAPYQKTAI